METQLCPLHEQCELWQGLNLSKAWVSQPEAEDNHTNPTALSEILNSSLQSRCLPHPHQLYAGYSLLQPCTNLDPVSAQICTLPPRRLTLWTTPKLPARWPPGGLAHGRHWQEKGPGGGGGGAGERLGCFSPVPAVVGA